MDALTHAQHAFLTDLMDEEPDFLHERVLDDTERYTAEALEHRGLLVLDGWHVAKLHRAKCEEAMQRPCTGPEYRGPKKGRRMSRDEPLKFGKERFGD